MPVFGEHTAPTEVELQEMWYAGSLCFQDSGVGKEGESCAVRVTVKRVRLCRSLIAHEGGHRLAGALLHYMADRVQHEQRWTDALKQVPSTYRQFFCNCGREHDLTLQRL